MVGAVEDEVVGADDGLCVLRGEVLPVWDILWERVESVAASALGMAYRSEEAYSLQ